MDTIPPTYDEATTSLQDPLPIFAPYISSRYELLPTLLSACLVSKKWNAVFAPLLWGSPLSHHVPSYLTLHTADQDAETKDQLLLALHRFCKILKRDVVREEVRRLVFMLRIPKGWGEQDGSNAPSLDASWIRMLLEQLPGLQVFSVDGVGTVDHLSLSAIGSSKLLAENPPMNMRMLSASKCTNTTPTSLGLAIGRMTSLVVLDLSHTPAARDRRFLWELRNLHFLHVLKLRHVGLSRDEDVRVLAEAIGLKVRSLDVSDNGIGDEGAAFLAQKCFPVLNREGVEESGDQRFGWNGFVKVAGKIRRRRSFQKNGDALSWIGRDATKDVGVWRPRSTVEEELRGESMEKGIIDRFTSGPVDPVRETTLLPTYLGLTHLYIAGNQLTTNGVTSLIRTGNLHVLDVGEVTQYETLRRGDQRRLPMSEGARDYTGASPLVNEMGFYTPLDLTYLRIHNTLVTKGVLRKAGPKTMLRNPQETSLVGNGELAPDSLDGSTAKLSLNAPAYAAGEQNNAAPPSYDQHDDPQEPELSKPTATRKASIASQSESIAQSQSSNGRRTSSSWRNAFQRNRKGSSISQNIPTQTVIPIPTAVAPQKGDDLDDNGPFSPTEDGPDVPSPFSSFEDRYGFLPGHIRSLKTLVLTNVPCNTPSESKAIEALKAFLTDCAAEAHRAEQLAAQEMDSLAFSSPIALRPAFRRARAKHFFALEKIVFEMAPAKLGATICSPTDAAEAAYASSQPSTGMRSPGTTKTWSTTEDADSEAMWLASENDFSFFDDEKIVPSSMSRQGTGSRAGTDGKGKGAAAELSRTNTGMSSSLSEGGQIMGGGVRDTVQELAAFRRERKVAFEKMAFEGGGEGLVEGYWPGEIKIVRPVGKKGDGY
ncbi:hypothetical protein MMC25_005082 [Agyrium rufum]|nr:hypothetical protein [Agyrium rufum]